MVSLIAKATKTDMLTTSVIGRDYISKLTLNGSPNSTTVSIALPGITNAVAPSLKLSLLGLWAIFVLLSCCWTRVSISYCALIPVASSFPPLFCACDSWKSCNRHIHSPRAQKIFRHLTRDNDVAFTQAEPSPW